MSTVPSRQRKAVSLAGCGYMAMYHVGVGMAVQEHAPQFLLKLDNLYGSSAGSIVAVFAACGLSADKGYTFMKELSEKAHPNTFWGRLASLHPTFDLIKLVRSRLEKCLPCNAHRKCRGKVGVSLTILPSMENWIVSDFNTRAELIQAVVCSCFIPLYCGVKIPVFRGKYCCDGGLSSNLPFSNDPMVITVSPFSGECDICPASANESYYQVYLMKQSVHISTNNIYRTFGALFMLPWSEMEIIREQGYNDTLRFLKKEDPSLVPLTVIAEEEATSDYCSITTNTTASCYSSIDDMTVECGDLSLVKRWYRSVMDCSTSLITLRLGAEVWSRVNSQWRNFMHRLSLSHPHKMATIVRSLTGSGCGYGNCVFS